MSLLPNKFVNLDISTCDVQQDSSVFRVFKGLTPFFFSSGHDNGFRAGTPKHDNGFRAGSPKGLGLGTHPGKPLKETSDKARNGALLTL